MDRDLGAGRVIKREREWPRLGRDEWLAETADSLKKAGKIPEEG